MSKHNPSLELKMLRHDLDSLLQALRRLEKSQSNVLVATAHKSAADKLQQIIATAKWS